MNHNETVYAAGFTTTNSSWVNFARASANSALFGWRGTSATVNGGNAVKDFGTLISNSTRFSQCMVKRVYEAVCRKNIEIKDNPGFFQAKANEFEANGYRLKDLFAQVAASPECAQ